MSDLKTNLLNPHAWLRALYMLLIGLCLYIAVWVAVIIAFIQFVITLVSGEENENLRGAASVTARYLKQSADYLCYNTETKPFPFSDLPAAEQDEINIPEDDAPVVDGELEENTRGD